jgi:hypothetical protein
MSEFNFVSNPRYSAGICPNPNAVGPAKRPPVATEMYAAARVIGFKCFEEK